MYPRSSTIMSHPWTAVSPSTRVDDAEVSRCLLMGSSPAILVRNFKRAWEPIEIPHHGRLDLHLPAQAVAPGQWTMVVGTCCGELVFGGSNSQHHWISFVSSDITTLKLHLWDSHRYYHHRPRRCCCAVASGDKGMPDVRQQIPLGEGIAHEIPANDPGRHCHGKP